MMTDQNTFDFATQPVIKGYPELRWTGKRPFKSTQYYPAQLKESYGPETNGWINKIFWGDNLQVMSHLLQKFRGKIDLIYIDPPFDSKADYKKRISLKGNTVLGDASSFEEKQYGDIWTNDEYLQFMYERLILLRELLADTGSIYLHCDYRKSSHLRIIMDEIFGVDNFRNEIIWSYRTGGAPKDFSLARKHDTILFYSKSGEFKIYPKKERQYLDKSFMGSKIDSSGKFYVDTILRDVFEGVIDIVSNNEIDKIKGYNTRAVLNLSAERVDYPTQKPEGLLELLIELATKKGDLVFDCFMGSGTTQAVAMQLGRRFIGADINLGAIQTTTKRLINVAEKLKARYSLLANDTVQEEQGLYAADFDLNSEDSNQSYTGFEVYNVNNYDFFRNPLEARQLLIEALGVQPSLQDNIWDGELDGRRVKIMPVNRIASKADLEALIANLPYKTYERRKEQNPNQPVEKITIVCMGHEADLKASLEHALKEYKIDVEIVDILRDKTDIQFKREAEAEIVVDKGFLVIRSFYPLNLMQKLSLQREYVEDWRELVETIAIDWNYDGAVMHPSLLDIPDKNELVKGKYKIPSGRGTVKVKITDLLSESLEIEVVV